MSLKKISPTKQQSEHGCVRAGVWSLRSKTWQTIVLRTAVLKMNVFYCRRCCRLPGIIITAGIICRVPQSSCLGSPTFVALCFLLGVRANTLAALAILLLLWPHQSFQYSPRTKIWNCKFPAAHQFYYSCHELPLQDRGEHHVAFLQKI